MRAAPKPVGACHYGHVMVGNAFTYDDLADLEESVGPATFARGMMHAKLHEVRQMRWYPKDEALDGIIEGSVGDYYEATALFDMEHGGGFVEGNCTCPVEFDCKHVVALVIAAMPQNREPKPQPVAPPPKPTWEQSLSALLPTAPPKSNEVHTATNQLAIELTLTPPPPTAAAKARPTLRIKPVKPGSKGWISGGLTWTSVSQMHAASGHPHDQIRLLREFYAVFQSQTGRVSYYRHEEKDFDLALFDSPRLWPLLDEAVRRGIKLINGRRDIGPKPYGEAEFCLDVTETASGDLIVVPVVRIDDEPVSSLAIAFIGETAHGVFTTDHANRVRLAKLTKPVARHLQQMVVESRGLEIPASEKDRFVTEYFPALQRQATILSSNGSFTPPVVSEPTLALLASYGEGHNLTVDWEWAYTVGDHEMRAPLDPRGGGASYRDLERERDILLDLDLPIEQYDDGPGHKQTALSNRTVLGGIDTMRFTTEVLPLYADRDGLRIEVDGTPADYREAGDSLRIGLSTSATSKSNDWFDLGVTISVEGQEVPFADVFTALANDLTHLLLPSGAYFSLEKPELQSLRELIEEARGLQDNPNGPLRLSRYQAGLWDEFAQLGVIESQAWEWRAQVDGLLKLPGLAPIAPPRTLNAELRPYQLDGFTWLAFLWQHKLGGILADDMGLGKTIQSLALICHARQADPDAPPFLIIAPTSVVPNWAAESRRFAPGLKIAAIDKAIKASDMARLGNADVVITSYTRFRLDFDTYSAMSWSALILDEVQFVKNHQSKAYQCVRKLETPFKLAITGTPMENNLMELWSLLSITAPGLFPNIKKFGDYYRKPIENQGDAELLAQLRRRIKPLLLRRTKDQVAADLPAKQEQVLELELNPRHRKIYQTHLQRERQKILGLISDMDKNRFTIFRSLTMLRQLSLHAGLVEDEHEGVPSVKIEALTEQLHDVIDGGHRALIFSQFTSFLSKVRDRLDAEGITYAYLDGSTKDRGAVVEQFKSGGAPVFLISLKAGGFGLNLTEADYVFLLDPWWNPATEAQAIDRTHRIGQTRSVMVYRLIAKDTIEEKVMALKAKKAELFASVMDADTMLSTAMTADDIKSLFE